ncbi:MAG: protein kinase, partial [Chloroflexi bacterium]|nr:protein kinase [Chloroflexota bacterium]
MAVWPLKNVKGERFQRQALALLHRLAAHYEAGGAYESALPHAWRQVELDPFQEPAQQQIMRLLALTGQRAAALSQYESLKQLLAEEMGMAPTTRTTQLHEQIKAGNLELPLAQPDKIRGYKLLEEIGVGTFGAVHRAYQPVVAREVAIKIILPRYANQPDFIRRFEAEAHMAARLEHPHIVPLYDYWRDPDGAYLVMRLFRGGNLERMLQKGPAALDTAVTLTDQIASALTVAHRHGVIHRDLKPANILLDEEGNAYLSDFGIAKDLTSSQNLTEVGAILGSPAYISPEQVLSEPITPLADIYSFGVILYSLLTGKPPFPGESMAALIHNHLHEPLPLVYEQNANIPPQVDAVIQQATAKKPDARYPDAQSLAHAFHEAVYQVGVTILPEPPPLPVEGDLINPYKGLRAFQERDCDHFFGREKLVAQLLSRRSPFLAVVGPSGSGKSSVVKAGLVPALRQGGIPGSENWFMVTMTPGAHPLEELEAALLHVAVNPPPSLIEPLQKDNRGLIRTVKRILPCDQDEERPSELLLLIDQFEELFTLVEDEAVRNHFIDSLVTAVRDPRSRIRIIITLRADFYDRPLQRPGLGELLRQHTEVVLPLTPAELEQAISNPARLAGVTAEPGLIAAIVADISKQPGALPLLQYALTELFEQRDGRVMTQSIYTAIGGVAGALSRRAEEIYQSLDETGQEAARQL